MLVCYHLEQIIYCLFKNILSVIIFCKKRKEEEIRLLSLFHYSKKYNLCCRFIIEKLGCHLVGV